MTTAEATLEIRDVLAGRPGGVNRVIKRFGKPVVDYATALIPDRSAPFERLVEDILVDIVSQCRAASRADSDDEVFEFAMEAALRTVRSRYREVLEADARPDKATTSWSFKEAMERTKLTEDELTRSISEGRIKAVRDHDEMRIKGEGIEGLSDRKSFVAYNISAAERELLCLHYTLGFSPETIARWGGVTTGQIEEKLGKASTRLVEGMARKREQAPNQEDTTMRRYIDGRMGDDETVKFERGILKNKIAQRRLDELRSETMAIKQLFESPPYDLSSTAVDVRSRNPHHSVFLPPMAALWLQVIGIAAMVLVFHNVGAYIAPPDVRVSVAAGEVPGLPADGFVSVGDAVATPAGAQALMVLDSSNRVLLAPGSEVSLLEPRPEARQVLRLERGEIWGRFTSSGRAFVVQFPGGDGETYEAGSNGGADFDLVVGESAAGLLPQTVARERARAFADAFDEDLAATTPIARRAGYGIEGDGLRAGERITRVGDMDIRNATHLAELLAGMKLGDSVRITVESGGEHRTTSLNRVEEAPRAVLRVFSGALEVGLAGGDRVLVNRDQWAVFADSQPPMVGVRGHEDFRVLRIDASERFKQHVHWLNTSSYPLRAENSTLAVDRGLRELAAELEAMRAGEIRRDGAREIRRFERLIRGTIAEARERIESGEPREGEDGVSLSDERLVAAEEVILGHIAHWRKQAASDIHPTLGSAARTVQGLIDRLNNQLEGIGESMTESQIRQDRIADLDEAIRLKDDEIAELKASAFFDDDGEKRHELEAKINDLQEAVRRGQTAEGQIERLTNRLNRLDDRIDVERRKLADLRAAVENAQQKLDDINADLEANIYSADALSDAAKSKVEAETALENANDSLARARLNHEKAAEQHAEAEEELDKARAPLDGLKKTRNEASDGLTDAVSERTAAGKAVDEAQSKVDRLKSELDEMEEDDPEREARQAELDDAQKELAEAKTTLKEKQEDADNAKAALDKAEDALEKAENLVEQREATLEERSTAVKESQDAVSNAKDDVAAKQQALNAAKERVSALEDAKTARAQLEAERETAAAELASASQDLKAIEGRVAELNEQAQPHRDELAEKLSVVEQGKDAATEIKTLKNQRERYQAVSDEIELRLKDREVLLEERNRLAGSDLVTGYDDLVENYAEISRRIGALRYLQTRAINEDQSLAAEQNKARDRFRDASERAAGDAVELLREHCPPYSGDSYQPVLNDGDSLRDAILAALWKLYYFAGTDGESDGDGNLCYYVVMESGGDKQALGALDSRWNAYLTEALGREGFEKVANLTPADLRRPETRSD